MKSLKCAMFGLEPTFVIDIDEHQSVWQLKEMIKEYTFIPVSPKDFKLYVAKTDGGNWLSCGDPNVKQLVEGVVSAEIADLMARNGEMDDTFPISHTAYGFPDEEEIDDVDYVPDHEDVHILVDISEHGKNELRLLHSLDEFAYHSRAKFLYSLPPGPFEWLATFFSPPYEASPSKKEV